MTVAELERELLGSQTPRVRWVPDERAKSRGVEAVEWAASVGLELDEWQRDVLVDGCRLKPDGTWLTMKVGVNVGRQNGKGGILEAREGCGLFEWDDRLITHSAHQFDTSLEAFRRLEALIDANAELSKQVKRVSRSHGEEGFELFNKNRIRYRTRTAGGGRGFSGDLLILDEAMFLTLFSHSALFPTLSARENPQVWYTGSAVDQEVHEHGLVFAQVRENALKGSDRSLAYFEWSLDFDTPAEVPDEVAADPESWAACNPAFGIRIDADYLESELAALDHRSFCVERLGVGDWPDLNVGAEEIIPLELWDALADPESKLENPVTLAFDVGPDRSSAIAAAGRRRDGLLHGEIIRARTGTGWLVDELVALNQKHKPRAIICDAYGPVASVCAKLEAKGLTIEKVTTHEHAQACGALVDLVAEAGLRHLGDDILRRALKGAKTRALTDAWAWSRKNSSVNISPLVALTLGVFGAAQQKGEVFAAAW